MANRRTDCAPTQTPAPPSSSFAYPLVQQGCPIQFDVPSGPLLWGTVFPQLTATFADHVAPGSQAWGAVDDKWGRVPWEHQTETVQDMVTASDNGQSGHFLWIPVGMGKTYIVLKYLRNLMDRSQLPPYVVYTLPSSAMQSVLTEVEAFGFAVEVHVLRACTCVWLGGCTLPAG